MQKAARSGHPHVLRQSAVAPQCADARQEPRWSLNGVRLMRLLACGPAVVWLTVCAMAWPAGADAQPPIDVRQTAEFIEIDTDALQARVNKSGYVSGIGRGSFLDKKTGARDLGFGLHIMDF